MNHSGRFVLRLPTPLHGRLAREAKQRKVSLNHICVGLLRDGLEKKPETEPWIEALSPLLPPLKKRFGKDLLGVLVFGSQVTGRATESSDIDLLIILTESVPLTRALYRWWDENMSPPPGPVVNPQFVHLPEMPETAGGLWLEIASASRILWEEGNAATKAIETLKALIARDHFRRYWSNGSPYWVKM